MFYLYTVTLTLGIINQRARDTEEQTKPVKCRAGTNTNEIM